MCWYAERSLPTAEAFDEAIKQALAEFEEAPHRYPAVDHRHRIKLLVKTFPHHIIYRASGETSTVIAVAHHRRKPRYWRDRQ